MQYRAVSLCIFRRDEQYLFVEKYDKTLGVTYYRPVGGTIEFGEDSKSTVIREVREEINAEISTPKLLAVIENIFPYEDSIGHDLDFIYEAELLDRSYYDQKQITGHEGEKNFTAVWIDLNSIKNDPTKMLVPSGLMDILTGETNQGINNVIHYSSL